MLYEYSKNIAYICPYCGKLTTRDITLFDLPKSGADFICSDEMCREKIMSVTHKRDRYVFEVKCTACDSTHTFRMKHSNFWSNDLTVLSCPNTSVDILFLGKKDKIEEELKHQNELYRDAEKEISESAPLGIYFGVIRIINLLAKEDKISCSKCGGKAFNIELTDDGVKLSCRGCDARALLGIDIGSIQKLIDEHEIILK